MLFGKYRINKGKIFFPISLSLISLMILYLTNSSEILYKYPLKILNLGARKIELTLKSNSTFINTKFTSKNGTLQGYLILDNFSEVILKKVIIENISNTNNYILKIPDSDILAKNY